MQTASGVGTTMYFQFSVEPDSQEQVSVTITGPETWNEGYPFDIDFGTVGTGTHWRWKTYSYNSYPAVAGTYLVELRVDDATFRSTVLLDNNETLQLVSEPVLLEPTTERVDTSWQPVAGAESYYVRLYLAAESGFETLRSVYTRQTSATFRDLQLSAGVRYYVGVHAFSSDLTGTMPDVPLTQFNVSFESTSFVP